MNLFHIQSQTQTSRTHSLAKSTHFQEPHDIQDSTSHQQNIIKKFDVDTSCACIIQKNKAKNL